MTARMELVAGDVRDVLVAIGTGDTTSFADGSRFAAYLSLTGGMDPTWLDMFADAARRATDLDAPADFIDARIELDRPSAPEEGVPDITIERVDPSWVLAVARIPDLALGALAGHWIDRIEEELGPLPREEKPWIRELAGRVVEFCRLADRSADVLFLWAL